MSVSVSDSVNTPQVTLNVVISMEKMIVKYMDSKLGFVSVTSVGHALVPARSLPSRFSDLLPAL